MIEERYQLAWERLQKITTEEILTEKWNDYFHQVASFLLLLVQEYQFIQEGKLTACSLQELQQRNRQLYEDILPEYYDKSYGNPDYSVAQLGEEYGQIMGFLYAELRAAIPFVFEQNKEELTLRMELFIQIYSSCCCSYEETSKLPEGAALKEILYYFISDYTHAAYEQKIRNIVDPKQSFAKHLVEESDLSDIRYLYYFGEYITQNEIETSRFLHSLDEETICRMADTYTEGYRMGFLMGNKDITIKKSVNIRYSLGFERMIRKAIQNFKEFNLQTTIYRAPDSVLLGRSVSRNGYFGAIPNKQYEFDHKDDQALILDSRLLQVRMEALQQAFEHHKELAALHGGPAIVEVFGEKSISLQSRKNAIHLSEEQQKMLVSFTSKAGDLQNRYIKGEERSFTIIAFPVPDIGTKYPEIFQEVIKLNTLDYKLYQRIQQHIIDTLDLGQYVLVKGMHGNRTNMKVMLHNLKSPEQETNFENCVADVNIPVGEVFTSPVLTGTEGTLHVGRVYLSELEYKDMVITFENGMVKDYSCRNFDTDEENRKYIRDNVLFHHDSLPIGEFAIGTNTTAFVMARNYHIEEKLPILIAEKTGPHFALGDTCYSHEEDTVTYNPDGKRIIARENECSMKRNTVPAEAYFNCHTDITIPYDELGEVSVVTAENEVIPIIVEGRFVLPGCEELNIPFQLQ